jgi:group I intron endonuclease
MEGFIYLWENKHNGKKYIGSHTGTPDDGYIGSGVVFSRAIEKYGIESFTRTILEFVDKNIMEREQYYLDKHSAAEDPMFYNINPQAGGGWKYVNSVPEFRKKVIEKNKNLWSDKEHPKGFKGKSHTNEAWDKTREGWDEWAKEKLYRPVLQYTLGGLLVNEYESISAAARAVNGRPSNIKYTIEGKFKKAYGYAWKYKDKK